jgi:hypothetical protein
MVGVVAAARVSLNRSPKEGEHPSVRGVPPTIRGGRRWCGEHSRITRPAATRRSNSSRGYGAGASRTAEEPLTSQAIGVLWRNQLYAGIVDVPEYGVRGKRGDLEPLISEELFYRVQAVLSGRMPQELAASADLAKAQPDTDFRYRSNATARLSSANSTTTSICHGRPFAVWGQRPALCASSRARQSLVTPV